MPRIKARKKSLKNGADGIRLMAEAVKDQERKRAMKALEKAKELEEKRTQGGYVWVKNGKTKKLVKNEG